MNNFSKEYKNSFLVRPATIKDTKDIFDWRNDELTRKMSINTNSLAWEDHKLWFRDSLESKSRVLLICEQISGAKLSIVHFDISEDSALVSINFNPQHRGKGLAKNCLSKSIEYLSNNTLEVFRLIAKIRRENIVSQKIFLGVGFKKCNSQENVILYEKSLI